MRRQIAESKQRTVLKINLNELPAAPAEPVNLTVEYIPLSADLEMVNGGAPYKVGRRSFIEPSK